MYLYVEDQGELETIYLADDCSDYIDNITEKAYQKSSTEQLWEDAVELTSAIAAIKGLKEFALLLRLKVAGEANRDQLLRLKYLQKWGIKFPDYRALTSNDRQVLTDLIEDRFRILIRLSVTTSANLWNAGLCAGYAQLHKAGLKEMHCFSTSGKLKRKGMYNDIFQAGTLGCVPSSDQGWASFDFTENTAEKILHALSGAFATTRGKVIPNPSVLAIKATDDASEDE